MFNDTGRYIIRSDTLANWNKFNPILRYGELVAIYSANEIPKLKIGNGTDTFTDLPILNYDIHISDTEYLFFICLFFVSIHKEPSMIGCSVVLIGSVSCL